MNQLIYQSMQLGLVQIVRKLQKILTLQFIQINI